MITSTYIIIVPAVLFLCGGAYLMLRSFFRIWLEHRVKMALLEKLERQPDLAGTFPEIQRLLDTPAPPDRAAPINYVLTGIFLALIGLSCAILAQRYFSGRYATGVYFGGVLCVPVGFMMTLLGLVTRLLSRTRLPRRSPSG